MSKRICPVHGVYEANTNGCPSCKRQSSKHYDKTIRNTEVSKFYQSAAWKIARAMHLRAEPLCVVCMDPAQIVDHIVEIKDGGCRLCDDNLQSMCLACHNAKTKRAAREREGRV